MKKGILFAVLAVAVFAIVYNLPYFKDGRAFEEVKRQQTPFACRQYLTEYPNGRFADDVMFLAQEYAAEEYRMDYINDYLNAYPYGKYAERVNQIADSIWDDKIAQYKSGDKSRMAPNAIDFMDALLEYMKDNRVNAIKMEVVSDLQLKDYDEYPEYIRTFLELLNDEKLSIAEGMISLKDNFSSGNVNTLNYILTEGVQNSLDGIFGENFITVVAPDEDSFQAVKAPVLKIDYRIANQEFVFGDELVPHIWNYVETESTAYGIKGKEVLKNFLIGISVDFKLVFTVPDSNKEYVYQASGEPENNINGIDDIRDGYAQMTKISFRNFADTLAANLGLPAASEIDNDDIVVSDDSDYEIYEEVDSVAVM